MLLIKVWKHFDSCPGQPVGVKVRFDNGITGFIPNKYLSDRPESFMNPAERVQVSSYFLLVIIPLALIFKDLSLHLCLTDKPASLLPYFGCRSGEVFMYMFLSIL